MPCALSFVQNGSHSYMSQNSLRNTPGSRISALLLTSPPVSPVSYLVHWMQTHNLKRGKKEKK